jgi:hypothetical protein
VIVSDVATRNRIGQGPIVTIQKRRCDFAGAGATERPRFSERWCGRMQRGENYHATQIASIGRHRGVIDDGVVGRLRASFRWRRRHRGSAGRCFVRRRQRGTAGGYADQPGISGHLVGARRTIEHHDRNGHRPNVHHAQSKPLPVRRAQYVVGHERDRPVAERHAGRGRHYARLSRAHGTLEHDPEKCEAIFRKDHADTIT